MDTSNIEKITNTTNGKLNEFYSNGEKHGSFTTFNHKGKYGEHLMSTKCTYFNGKLHGVKTDYFKDGKTVKREFNYIDGKKHGQQTVFNMRGKIMSVEHYNMGVKI